MTRRRTCLMMTGLLLMALAGDWAGAEPPLWRIDDQIDIAPVPSWFPVGFALMTCGQRQYVAYYDVQHRMTVAARSLDQRRWQRVVLDSKVGWDSHNYITMARDARGHLHLSGNMHCVPLIYFRTDRPDDITTFRRQAMVGRNEQRCTYPRFLHDKAGRLIFTYREGGSGNGRRFYNVYDPQRQQWSRLLPTPLFEGQGLRNAYPTGPVLGPDGRFHVTWVWRDTPDCATNNNLSYARSDDLVHWQTIDGRPITLPMTLQTPGLIVDPIPSGGGLVNGGTRLIFDAHHRPLLVYHKSDAQDHMQIFVARFQDGHWTGKPITAWDKPVKFSGRGAMPFLGIALTSVRRAGDGVWVVGYHHRDYGRGLVAFDEKTLQPVHSFTCPPPELPKPLTRPQIRFPGIGIRRAEDLGDSGRPDVRYLLKWDVLPANHDRKRTGPLPPPSMLRLYKLVRNDRP